MTIIADATSKTIIIINDSASSNEELTFHVEADADMAVINVEDIKEE